MSGRTVLVEGQQWKFKMEQMKNMSSSEKEDNFTIMNGVWSAMCPFKIEKITDGYDGLEIHICANDSTKNRGVFHFDVFYGYRNFDEGHLWKRWKLNRGLQSNLYRSSDSELLRWAAEQSPFQEVPNNLSNFLFVSVDDVFDVLAFDVPSFALTT